MTWREIFAALDAARIPEDYLSETERNQGRLRLHPGPRRVDFSCPPEQHHGWRVWV